MVTGFIGVADPWHDSDICCKLFGRTEIIHIADHRQQCGSPFGSDPLDTGQIVKAIHLGTVIRNGLVQFFNTLVQTPDLIDHDAKFHIADSIKMV